MKKLILVTSPPACGKTFISKQVAKALPNCVYLDKDTLIVLSKQIFVVAGEEYNRSSDFFQKNIRSCILEFSRQNKNGCIGYPTVNSLVRFIDEEGNVIENGSEKQPALLAWGGPIVMEGYYNDPELTAKTVVDGYVMTNDLGYMDEDGSIILVGRADDVINYGGSKISPAEVETVAIRYPGVADCAYSSVQDPITGELPVMLIVQEDGFDETAFQSYMQQQVESYKLPQKIFYIEKVPKTFKGSLLRKEIKKIAESKNKGE